MFIPKSELIINADNSIYHLRLKPGDIASTIITVGDPDRVDMVAQHFDSISLERQNREFKTITGLVQDKEVSVISTGIGTDNIDIVINELDALMNIDFATRKVKDKHHALKIIRLGTSGAIQKSLPIDSILISKYAIGLDGLLQFYKSSSVRIKEIEKQINTPYSSYAVSCDDKLFNSFVHLGTAGITITANGFYGPQGRKVKLDTAFTLEDFKDVHYEGLSCTNLEMETAGIYGLAALLGHEAISLSAILANRIDHHFSEQAHETVTKLISNAMKVVQDL